MTTRAIEPARPGELATTTPAGPFEGVLSGLSAHTVRAYKRHLEAFLAWYTSQRFPGLSRAVVVAYRGYLQAQGKRPPTINQALSAIRLMVGEAAENGKLDRETAAAIGRVRNIKSQALPAGRALASGELYALLNACEAGPAGVRDAAMIALLYSAGLRRGELAGLDLADYDAALGELKILHAKGNKQRLVPVQNGAAAALADWLKARGDWPGPLFCPVYRSGHIKPDRLTTQAVYHIIQKRARLAGLEKRISPHDFRRTVIGDLLDRGADMVTVQHLVGHSKPETTARYDRRGDATKRKAVGLLHVPYRSKEK